MAFTEKNQQIGTKRVVVGAHYGTFDFIVQRVTAVILAVYTIILLIGFLSMSGVTYDGWLNLFTFTVGMFPMGQVLATLAFISICWHAWIGVRDIWMDYVKPIGVRMLLQVLTILWLVGTLAYFVHILWRV